MKARKTRLQLMVERSFPDPVTVWLALLATAIGVAMVADAGFARAVRLENRPVSTETLKQLVFGVAGFFAASWVARQPIERVKRWAGPAFAVCLVALALVFVPGLGVARNGASRWIGLGPLDIQPAEFAKVVCVVFLAAGLAVRKPWKPNMRSHNALGRFVWPKIQRMAPALWVLVAVALIEFEPDLGTAAVVAATAFAMCWMAGAHWKTLVGGVAVAGVVVCALLIKEPYRLERFQEHFTRWDGLNMDGVAYQTVQSEIAMATGGLYGVGLGQGRAKHLLPAATTDFIPATIAEEVGFLGMVAVIAVLGFLALRLFRLAQAAQTPFQALLLGGVASWIGVQTVVNVIMANGFMPAIGIPLPFVSYGGSALIAYFAALGIVLNVHMRRFS